MFTPPFLPQPFPSWCSEKLLHSSSFYGSCFLLDSSCPRTLLGPQRSVLSHLLLSSLSLPQKSCPVSQHQLSRCEETSTSPELQSSGFSRLLDTSFHLAFGDIDNWNHLPSPKYLPLQTSCLCYGICTEMCTEMPSDLSNPLFSSLYPHIWLIINCYWFFHSSASEISSSYFTSLTF